MKEDCDPSSLHGRKLRFDRSVQCPLRAFGGP